MSEILIFGAGGDADLFVPKKSGAWSSVKAKVGADLVHSMAQLLVASNHSISLKSHKFTTNTTQLYLEQIPAPGKKTAIELAPLPDIASDTLPPDKRPRRASVVRSERIEKTGASGEKKLLQTKGEMPSPAPLPDLGIWVLRGGYLIKPDGLQENGTLPKNLILSTDVLPRTGAFIPASGGDDDAELWKTHHGWLDTLAPKAGEGPTTTLVTCAEAFRRAGYRTREEGSVSASVEDICQAILDPTSHPSAEEEQLFFRRFKSILVRIRGDALLLLRRTETKGGSGPWDIKLFYILQPNVDEWNRFHDAVHLLDPLLASVAIQWALGGKKDKQLEDGLQWCWRLVRRGVKLPEPDKDFDAWLEAVMSAVKKEDLKCACEVDTLSVDSQQVLCRNRWSILEASLSSDIDRNLPSREKIKALKKRTFDYARHLAIHGFGIRRTADKTVPEVKFFQLGALETVDRSEVESLSGIRRLMAAYPMRLARAQGSAEKPLCLAVFGAPGSGKSFGVEEIAKSLAQHPATHTGSLPMAENPLTFNVSQFTHLGDLAAAMQQIREKRLSGGIPLVIFDEFDSSFEGHSFGWLKYFLMPMQDGKFRDGSTEYHTGGCVMVFAGGINHRYAEFTGRLRDKDFATAKGPDFISRLRGVHDIPSLTADDSDLPRWQIRRAGLLHNFLKKYKVRLANSQLLDALLTVSRFHHGARSLEAVVQMSTPNERHEIDVTSLPRRDQLDLHVDSNELWQIMKQKSPETAV